MSIAREQITPFHNDTNISGLHTAVAYQWLRQHLPVDALMMPLQLSLSPLPVVPVHTKQYRGHIATTLAALTGPTGCLPPAYEETSLAQAHRRNYAYADFIALFQSRLADLLIEADAKYSAHKQSFWRDRGNNSFLKAVSAMGGFNDITKPDYSIRFATLFAEDRRNSTSLKAMLENIFTISVTIAEFQPCWHKIPEEECSFLSGRHRLGIDSCIGAYVQNAASHLHIILGPLTYAQFCNFLPSQSGINRLVVLTQLYCGLGLTFQIKLVLDKDEIPNANLTGKYRLGYDIWLRNNGPKQHRSDAIFDGKTMFSYTP